MKRFIIPILGLCLIVSCKSEQEKALDAAIGSNDLNALRECLSTYGETFDEALQAKYDAAYETLIKDSTLFACIESAGSVLGKYTAAQNYIKELPTGIHVEEANAVIAENKEKAEEAEKQLATMRKAFEMYKFGLFSFTGPDDNGKGEITGKYSQSYQRRHSYYVIGYDYDVTTNIHGTYWVDDDFLMHASVEETQNINYKSLWGNKWLREEKDKVADLKKEIRAHHKDTKRDYIFILNVVEGDAYLKVKSKNGDAVLSGKLK